MLKAMFCKCELKGEGYVKEYLCELQVNNVIESLLDTESVYTKDLCVCAICDEESSIENVFCVELTNGDTVTDVICCYDCATKLFRSILKDLDNQTTQQEEPTVIGDAPVEVQEDVLDNKEQEEIKRTIKESIMHFGTSFVQNIDDLIKLDNYTYTDSLLTSLRNHALKLERNSSLYNKLLDSFKTIKEKREDSKGDKDKENKLANLLKSIVKGACEICKQLLIATGKSATSVCVLLSKIVAYSTVETLGTVKAIGKHYHDAFNNTVFGRTIKERKIQKEKDFTELENIMDEISL